MDRIKLAKANQLADEISRIAVQLDAMEQKEDNILTYRVGVFNDKGHEINTLTLEEADTDTVKAIKTNLTKRKTALEKEFESL